MYAAGVRRVMASLGMLELDPVDAPADEPPLRLVGEGDLDVPAIVAPFDGLCETLVGPLDRVTPAQVVAIVTDPLTGERAEVPSHRRRPGRPRPARGAGRQRTTTSSSSPSPKRGSPSDRRLPSDATPPAPSVRHRRPTVSRGQHPMITVRETGLVYRNPRPELRSRHTWHPTIVRFDDGEMLVTFDIAEADVALDYRTYATHSTDAGATWSAPERVVARPARPPDDPVGPHQPDVRRLGRRDGRA